MGNSKSEIKIIGWAFQKGENKILGGWEFTDLSLAPSGYAFSELQEIFLRRKEWDLQVSIIPSKEMVDLMWEEVERAQKEAENI